jgi:hypothetical protein
MAFLPLPEQIADLNKQLDAAKAENAVLQARLTAKTERTRGDEDSESEPTYAFPAELDAVREKGTLSEKSDGKTLTDLCLAAKKKAKG